MPATPTKALETFSNPAPAHRAAGLRHARYRVRARSAVRGAQVAEAVRLVVPRARRVPRGRGQRDCRPSRRGDARALPAPERTLQRAWRNPDHGCRRAPTTRLAPGRAAHPPVAGAPGSWRGARARVRGCAPGNPRVIRSVTRGRESAAE